ncbi:MAG TPA: hypothetical protein VN625_09385 [Desulfuromonadaceae bacterium]|nr:hypothetical protein [Desulfuromonadaceae bacterium]
MSRYDILAVCAVVAITGITIVVVEIFGHSREYSPQQHKIVVLQSQFALEKDGDHTNVVVSGVLTNASDYTWNLTRFEVRFLDAAGKTVDARQAGDDYMNLTVLAHGDRSFKLNLYLRAVPNHASSRITVTEARQPGFWYNND